MIDVDVGLEVINKRNNVKGVVIKKDEESIFIDISNTGFSSNSLSVMATVWSIPLM